MRVLFVCKSLPFAFKGGIQTHVWELTQQLVRLGCEVSILTAGSWRGGLEVTEHEGRTIIHLPYPPGRRVPFLRKTLEDVAFNVAAYGWLRKHAHAYDRVHLQGRSGCFFAAARPKGSVTTIATFHRLLDVEYEYDGQRTGFIDGWLHRQIMGAAERACARQADHVVSVSQEMQRELTDYVGPPLAPHSILPNGVRPGFGDPMVDRQRWQLVFVGRLETIKGIYTLIEALPKFDERIELTLIGEGPERRGLETRVRDLGLRLRVRFMGNQDSDSVRYAIQRSYALVLPSFHESQGIVLLEAGVCGRPVIAASVPGIDEVVEHGVNGLMFPAGDVESLAVVTNHLFRTPALAAKLGRAGRERALTTYDWANIAEHTLELYHQFDMEGAAVSAPFADARLQSSPTSLEHLNTRKL